MKTNIDKDALALAISTSIYAAGVSKDIEYEATNGSCETFSGEDIEAAAAWLDELRFTQRRSRNDD